MNSDQPLLSSIYDGWRAYQELLVGALLPLTAEQLEQRAAPGLRSVGEMATHVIGARARWFHLLLGEGGETFAALGRWDRRGEPARSAAELVQGLGQTWQGMHEAIARWTPEQWQQTWPGEDDTEPETITRSWVIWHLIEHDVHHGGEISITLGAHGVPAIDL